MPKKVSMSKSTFVKEHTHLVKVLKTGSPSERAHEASEQASELKKVKMSK